VTSDNTAPPLEFRTHASLSEIAEADWDALLPAEHLPYLKWSFLSALETTGCVAPERGWAPAHLSLRRAGSLVAVAPAYIKGNSEGEFVFDQSWAEFSYTRLRHAYYPKLVVACPFTPVTGPRILMRAGENEQTLLGAMCVGIRRATEQLELSSAHVLFPRSEQATALAHLGFEHRYGIQYHWRNAQYQSFDDFLGRYRSKQRMQIRRERRELEHQGLEIDVLTGSDLTPAVVDQLFAFYLSTVDKYTWGRRYLNREFFEEVCAKQAHDVLAVMARERGSTRYVAAAFNLLGSKRLFGRYWGASADYKCLHFNLCYYAGIEQCIQRGLEVFEPGAGGEHKVARGFEPTLTHSLHHLEHTELRRAVSSYLERERAAVLESLEANPGPLKPLAELGS
jgi:uncharacterized protein